MRTTLDINDALLAKAKTLAAKEHTSLTRLIEEGLALRLRSRTHLSDGERPTRPVFKGKGGLAASVSDTSSNRALFRCC